MIFSIVTEKPLKIRWIAILLILNVFSLHIAFGEKKTTKNLANPKNPPSCNKVFTKKDEEGDKNKLKNKKKDKNEIKKQKGEGISGRPSSDVLDGVFSYFLNHGIHGIKEEIEGNPRLGDLNTGGNFFLLGKIEFLLLEQELGKVKKINIIYKRVVKVLKYFDQAIETNSQLFEAYQYRGLIYMWLGQLERAIKDFNQIVETNPEFPNIYQIYKNRGEAYLRQDQFEKALEDFNSAIKINPQLVEAYIYRAFVLAEFNQLEKAKVDLVHLLKTSGSLSNLDYILFAFINITLGDFKAALHSLNVLKSRLGKTRFDLLSQLEKIISNLESLSSKGQEHPYLTTFIYFQDFLKDMTPQPSETQRDWKGLILHRLVNRVFSDVVY